MILYHVVVALGPCMRSKIKKWVAQPVVFVSRMSTLWLTKKFVYNLLIKSVGLVLYLPFKMAWKNLDNRMSHNKN